MPNTTQKNVKKKLVLKPSTSIICSDLGAELAVQSFGQVISVTWPKDYIIGLIDGFKYLSTTVELNYK